MRNKEIWGCLKKNEKLGETHESYWVDHVFPHDLMAITGGIQHFQTQRSGWPCFTRWLLSWSCSAKKQLYSRRLFVDFYARSIPRLWGGLSPDWARTWPQPRSKPLKAGAVGVLNGHNLHNLYLHNHGTDPLESNIAMQNPKSNELMWEIFQPCLMTPML